jgi:pyruvate/2-oxoglutarate dehydrogenase complex dihydrolipoamide acyltransferase (E2) component
MRHGTWIAAGLALACAGPSARAQLGADVAACRRTWGAPAAGSALATNGFGSLQFTTDTLRIGLGFVEGRVASATYHAAEFNDATLYRLLELNRGDSDWESWTPPGLKGAGDRVTRSWTRNDEGAMAQLTENGLTIWGVEWHGPAERGSPAPRTGAPQTPAVPDPAEREEAAPDRSAPRPRPRPAVRNTKPAAPAALPAVGDAKMDVVRLLGTPAGRMSLGDREAMVYPWGNVWLRDGAVIGVE